MAWTDLSDDELLDRLIRRGMYEERAKRYVDERDEPDVAELIESLLNG